MRTARWLKAVGVVVVLGVLWGVPAPAGAQSLGSFSWQLQPYCNRVTVAVTQSGAIYTLDGWDDGCQADQRTLVVGTATLNLNGTIGFGLHGVTGGGLPLHLDVTISLPHLTGTWRDNTGASGPFVFNGNAQGLPPRPGIPRPQTLITGACGAAQAIRAINPDGSVVCAGISGGGAGITSVSAGPGLTGGGTSGDVALGVVFGGSGSAAIAARADHSHLTGTLTVAIGPATAALATGSGITAVGYQTLRFNSSGSDNTALGYLAGDSNTFNSRNTFVGAYANTTTPTVSDATAIGARAVVSVPNALVLGATRGLNGATTATRVGIGTPAPAAMVEVVNDTTLTDVALFSSYGDNPEQTPRLTMRRARGARGTPADAIAADGLGQIGVSGYQGSSFSAQQAWIRFRAAATWTASSRPTDIQITTTPVGSLTPQDRIMIASDGDVGIGVFAPLDRLQVFGDVRLGTSGTNGCVKNFAGSGMIGVCVSDLRYKRDITPFGSVLNQVAALRPSHYFWRAESFPAMGFGPDRASGLVAQEVEALLPELVVTGEDGIKAVDYTQLPLLAIQAIGELKRENDALRLELEALARRLAAIESPRR